MDLCSRYYSGLRNHNLTYDRSTWGRQVYHSWYTHGSWRSIWGPPWADIMPGYKNKQNPVESGNIWRNFQMTVFDPVCFLLVLIRCRHCLCNAVHKNKENNEIRMDHLGRPGEYSLPFTPGSYDQKLAALVTPMVYGQDSWEPHTQIWSQWDRPFMLCLAWLLSLLSKENIFQAEFWLWVLTDSIINTDLLLRASCSWKSFSFLFLSRFPCKWLSD